MPIVSLDNNFIKHSLTCPDNKRSIEWCDDPKAGGVPGLYCRVQSTSQGSGTFYLRYKQPESGKTAHVKIGRSTDVSLAQARKEALRLRAEINKGDNPQQEKRELKKIPLLKDFVAETYLPHVKNRRSYSEYEGMFRRRILNRFGEKRMDKITRQDVQKFHHWLRYDEQLAPASCDKYVATIKHCFGVAVSYGILKDHPFSKIELFRENNSRERYLSDEELKQLVELMEQKRAKTNIADLVQFLIYTGCRSGEAKTLKWDRVSIENRTFVIDAALSKSKKTRSIPLNNSAIRILTRIQKEQAATGREHVYVFESTRRKGHPYVNINKIWDDFRQELGMPELRLHDLRHTHASYLINAGRSLFEVQNILGHATPQMTQRYAHLSTETLQEAANSASAAFDKAIGIDP